MGWRSAVWLWAVGACVAAVVSAAGVVFAQTVPADPLALMEQATQPASSSEITDISDLQRQLNAGIKPAVPPDPVRIARLAAALTDADACASMKRGADFLLRELMPDGRFAGTGGLDQSSWRYFAGDQEVGEAALAVQALIETGRATGDPRLLPFSKEMSPLVNWLLAAQTHQTYSAALQAGALALLPARPEVKKALDRVRTALVAGMREDGGYTYSLTNRTGAWDNSNTQYALLGLWAAAEAGTEIPQHFWLTADAHWRRTQSAEGGWAYRSSLKNGFVMNQPLGATVPLATLTVAGVASLYVTLDHLHGGRMQPGEDAALTRGLAAVNADFHTHMHTLGSDLYYAYGVQRVGVASGLKYLDGVNWLRHGAAAMMLTQRPNGAWTYAYNQLVGTSYALLFLAHGGSPVIFNKLQYEGEWNATPRDDANLTRRIGRTLELPLNWQIVSTASDPADWLDAPVLLLSGRGDPHFSAETLQKFRDFVQSGGMIFSTADDNDEAFTRAIRGYAEQMVEKRYTMRQLPTDHPLFTLYEPVHNPPGLLGLSNGVRELWVHSLVDLAASWQTFAYSNKDHWTIPLNLYMYATGRSPPRHRLDMLAAPANNTPVDRQMVMARLLYEGNADPEPGAWPRFSRLLHRDAGFDLQLPSVAIEKLDAKRTPFAYLTGTDRVKFSDAQREALRGFLRDGGTLLGDAAGGSEAFTQAFEDLAKLLAPQGESAIDIVPLDDPMWNGTLPASIRIRKETTEYRKATPASRRASGRPEIWVWTVGGRPAIYFSPLDITSGLLGTNTWGISGYAPVTAQAVARDLLLDVENARSKQ